MATDERPSIDDQMLAQLKTEIARWQAAYELHFGRVDQFLARVRQAIGQFDAIGPESGSTATATRILLGRIRTALSDLEAATPKIRTPLEMRTDHLQQRSEL